MKPALFLPLLSRVLSQPWAIRRETLVTMTQALLSGESASLIPRYQTAAAVPRERLDTTFRAWHYNGETYALQPVKMQTGYVGLNLEGVSADQRGTLPAVPENVTVLLVWGVLGRGWTEMDRWWDDPVEVDELTSAVAATAEGSTVVLWFRSPGGITTGIPETAAELRRLGKKRRLLAFSDDMCCSAAYWLGSQCEKIVASPTAALGSIGVYLALYDFVGYLEQMGVKLELFREGELKGIGLLGNPLDAKAREHLQAGVTECYRQFTREVTNMRDLATETMQGQSLVGKAAADAKLVDAFVPSAAAFFSSLTNGKI